LTILVTGLFVTYSQTAIFFYFSYIHWVKSCIWILWNIIKRIKETNNHKPNLILTEDDFSKVLVLPIQIHNNQGNKTDSVLLRNTSSRQKKAPVARSKDFLWQL